MFTILNNMIAFFNFLLRVCALGIHIKSKISTKVVLKINNNEYDKKTLPKRLTSSAIRKTRETTNKVNMVKSLK